MAVTVLKNPQGHKITGDPITGSISSGAGNAVINSLGHGLTTGDYVYVTSDIDEYNGFWTVTISGANAFTLAEYPDADAVPYYQALDEVTWYNTLPQEWHSIFLPIVYKLANDRWPINTVDEETTVSSTANDNGFLEIVASDDIKVGMNLLEYVKISNSPVAAYNGVWQIIEVIDDDQIVIDAPYTASSLAGASIQYYYNNYQVKVKIYAGLPTGHPWEDKKPYEEIAELSLTPDSDNQVMFSVADYIQGKVAIKNNTTLYSLPLNLDAFTSFYISTSETFDDSDNYTINTNESGFTDDTYEGWAIAGKLPFKNTYAGDFADYVYVEDAPASWLTLFPRLVAMEDRYFDIAFIKNVEGDFTLQIDKYIADYLTESEDVEFTDQGIGVYRLPITPDADFDTFCISVRPTIVTTGLDDLPPLSFFNNSVSSAEVDWTLGDNPTVTVIGTVTTGKSSEILNEPYVFTDGIEYTINFNYTVTGSGVITVRLYILDDSLNVLFSTVDTSQNAGTYDISVTFTATPEATRIGIMTVASLQNGATVTINELTGGLQSGVYYLTEEMCIDILSCNPRVGSIAETFFRLLEDGFSQRLTEDDDSRITE